MPGHFHRFVALVLLLGLLALLLAVIGMPGAMAEKLDGIVVVMSSFGALTSVVIGFVMAERK